MAFGEDADAGVAFAVFGLGAFGFFVGPLLVFFAFEGDLVLLAEVADETLEATVFLSSAVTFLGLAAAAAFFSGEAFLPFGDAAAFLPVLAFSPATRLTGVFLAFAPAVPDVFFSVADGFAEPEDADANLNDPDAPFPLVCTNDPEATADLRYFLMKGATFSASAL